ncbi:MAG: PAS domain-containing protein, partial [Deltaproteobacteria bacterium]|nr:PAS domain-containing protein [Deltaproteobacteria bacterium]
MKPTRPTPNEPPLPRDGGEDAFGKSLLGAAQVGTWSLDYDTGVVSADDQIAKMFGFPPDTPLQERPEAFFERMYPEDAAIVIAAIEHSRVTGEPFCAHYRVRLPDGSTRWVENRGRARRNQAGAVVELFGIAVDLTDQQRASRLILGEKLALRRALDGAPLETVLDILARTIEDVSTGAIVSIKLVDVDGIHLRRGSAPTLPPGFVQAMDYRSIGEGSGSSGFAAYRKQPVIVADIATHPIWENDRELALSYGLRSCWATPILSLDNHVVGTIAIYHRDPRQPNEREQEEVRTLARTASLVIDRSRALARDRFFVSLDDAVRPLVDPEEITLTSARLLGTYLGVNRCAYATVAEDEDTFDLTGNYTNGVESIVGSYTFRQFGAECLRLMRAGEPYVVYDSFADERITADERISYEMTAIRSVICVPIRKGEKFVAAMAVHMNAVREWLPEDIDLVKHVASRCWESIERARLNRYLQESEKQLRLLASSTSNLAWVAAADGSVIWLNDQWYTYTGTTTTEMEGWGGQSVVAPEALPDVMKRWIECVDNAHAFEMVFPIRGKDGTYRRFLTRANPVLDAHENVSRWVGTNTDVE